MNATYRLPRALGSGLFAACLALAGCGGDDDSSDTAPLPPPTTPEPTPTPTPPVSDIAAQRALVIDMDGLSYESLQDAISQGRAKSLQGMQVVPAWTGGRSRTFTEQPTTGRPSWASLLTSQWSWRHGMNWEQDDTALKAPTLFATLRQSRTDVRTAAIGMRTQYVSLLRPDADTGAINTLTDCSEQTESTDCVVNQAGQMVNEGYDLTVAQLNAAAPTPAQAVAAMDSAIGQLRARLDARRVTHPKESWLVILTTGYGADRYGSANGSQAVDSKTIFIASNVELGALGTDAAAPKTTSELYAKASIIDIAPTVLRHLGVPLNVESYPYEGQMLQAALAIRDTAFKPGEDKASLELSWHIEGTAAQPLRLLRDGQEIAVLAPDARTYVDDTLPATQDGRHEYRYTLAAGEVATSWSARIDYVAPMPLASTLTNGLQSYFSFDGGTRGDAKGLSTLRPWDANAEGGKSLAQDNFLGKWTGQAWRVDTSVVGANGVAGYRLRQNAGDITDNLQFTVGFWLRSNGMCARNLSNGVPVLSNKNWNSGGNPGITIGLWNGCEIRFNLGGSGRIDNSGYALTDEQWAYVALVVDRVANTFTSYVFDPVKGEQIKRATFSTALGNFAPGLGNGFSLAEDGTGAYITNENSAGSPRGQLDFNELALWNRVLSAEELTSVYRAGRPLSTLLP